MSNTTWAVEDVNRELRRLTPGWCDLWLDGSSSRETYDEEVQCSLAFNQLCTQTKLLRRIEQVQPWSQSVADNLVRAMLPGWTEQHNLSHHFVPPDWELVRSKAGAGRVFVAASLLLEEANSRLTLIEACERALALYELRCVERGVEARAAMREALKRSPTDSQGHDIAMQPTRPGALSADRTNSAAARAVSGVGRQGSDEQTENAEKLQQSEPGSQPGRRSAPMSARPAGVIIPCTECQAPLEPSKHKIMAIKAEPYCSYCYLRLKHNEPLRLTQR